MAERLAMEEAEAGHADRVREALSVVGKYADPEGPSRVGREHDDILADAYRQ